MSTLIWSRWRMWRSWQTTQVFADFLKALKGYAISWSVIECADLGVPQSRRRLVLLASRLGNAGLEMPTKQMPTPYGTLQNSDLPRIDAGATDAKDSLHTASRLSKLNMDRIQASKPGGTWRDWDESLRAACHVRDTGTTYPSVYGRMNGKPAPTITTQCFGFGNGRFGDPEQDRAISLREAAMLQTFPRSYKFTEPSEAIRFNRLGRLIGNAVPVRVGEVIGEVLLDHVRATSWQDSILRNEDSRPVA